MSVNFDPTGAQPEQVGPTFDIALGYLDPNTNLVKMYGYVVSPSGNSQEGTDVTDDQHLVQIASQASSDRFARFPQVSQGDWSLGERQRVFVQNNMYYQSDGNVDVSTPGNLTLFGDNVTQTVTLTGTFNTTPAITDGDQVFIGGKTDATHNIVRFQAGTLAYFQLNTGEEVFDMLYTPVGALCMTASGLFFFDNPGTTNLVVESMGNPELSSPSMAYFSPNGTTGTDKLYWIKNVANGIGLIKSWNFSTSTETTELTASNAEPYFSSICSTANGIFFSTSSDLPFHQFWYTWTGSAADQPTRIFDVEGRVEYAHEALGVTYVLCRNFQEGFRTHPAWTLYSINGTTVSVVDDARYLADPNFAPKCELVATFDGSIPSTSMDFKPCLWDDGRFLYVAWPGLATRRIDLIHGGLSQIGPDTSSGSANSVSARRFVTTNGQFLDLSTVGTTMYISAPTGTAQNSGTLISSFIDFDSPGAAKIFRSVQFATFEAFVGQQNIQFSYRLNQSDSFTVLPTVQSGPRNYTATFPPNVKGNECQLQVILTSDPTAGAPIMTSNTLIADQGRVINITVACRRRQGQRVQDQESLNMGQWSGQQLQANIMNIRNLGGGKCWAYIPDPTAENGVAQIQMDLLDYQRNTSTGAATGLRQVDGDADMEADIVLSLTEAFDSES